MVEVVDQPDVRPVIGDADQFDAVAAVGRGGGLELRLQQRDGLVGGVRTQRVVERGRKPGRLVRRIVPGEIGDAEGREHARPPPSALRGARRRASASAAIAPAAKPAPHRIGRPALAQHADLERQPDAPAPTSASAIAISSDALPPPRRRHRAGQPAVHEIAGDDRQQRAEHEGRIRRPAVQRHARQQFVHQMEDRRVPAERVEQRQHHRHREEADLARPQSPAHQAEAEHRDDRPARRSRSGRRSAR